MFHGLIRCRSTVGNKECQGRLGGFLQEPKAKDIEGVCFRGRICPGGEGKMGVAQDRGKVIK